MKIHFHCREKHSITISIIICIIIISSSSVIIPVMLLEMSAFTTFILEQSDWESGEKVN